VDAQRLDKRGRLRVYTMRGGGQAVASVYGIIHGDTFIYHPLTPSTRRQALHASPEEPR